MTSSGLHRRRILLTGLLNHARFIHPGRFRTNCACLLTLMPFFSAILLVGVKVASLGNLGKQSIVGDLRET